MCDNFEFYEDLVNTFNVVITDDIYKLQQHFNDCLQMCLKIAELQYHCFYIIDFNEFGIMYNIDNVIFNDDDVKIFTNRLSDLEERLFELSTTLNLIDIDKEEIILKPIFDKFERYIFSLSLGGDKELVKDVFKDIWGLFRLIYERLHPQTNIELTNVMAMKYKQIIDNYDYHNALHEHNTDEHYNGYRLNFSDVGYYFNYLYSIMTKFKDWLSDILPLYNIKLDDIILSKIDDNRQNDAHQSDKLPPELSTSEAMKIWNKAQGIGVIDDHYKWVETKVLLACFAKEMSDRFNLGKGTNSDGSKRINWKIFENLFGISNLRGALNDIKKTGENPVNINLVNDIFK